MTRRFIELHPGAAAKVAQLATACGLKPTTLTGVAAFELDLVGGGVGALLHYTSAKRAVGNQTA